MGARGMDAVSRRLAGILAADVVGYSLLLAADEAGTVDSLRALRRDIVDPLLAQHGGRIFKTTGDGLMAEFPSAVQALRCAISIQDRIRADPAGAGRPVQKDAMRCPQGLRP